MKQDIVVELDVIVTNDGGYDPNEEWTDDSYSSMWTFERVLKTNSTGSRTTTIHDYKPNEKIYVIYVIYSTGDSFSHDRDGRCELIGATHDSKLAYRIKEFIEKDYKNEDTEHDYELKDIGGVKFHTYPWKGYFESLSYVRVEECNPLG